MQWYASLVPKQKWVNSLEINLHVIAVHYFTTNGCLQVLHTLLILSMIWKPEFNLVPKCWTTRQTYTKIFFTSSANQYTALNLLWNRYHWVVMFASLFKLLHFNKHWCFFDYIVFKIWQEVHLRLLRILAVALLGLIYWGWEEGKLVEYTLRFARWTGTISLVPGLTIKWSR